MSGGHFENGTIIIFVGTSGSGRKTIAHQIGKELGFQYVVSYTTRERRPAETDGKEYHFTTRKQFIEEDIQGEFIQTVELDNHFYGIKKADVEAAWKANPVLYVIVNRSGANKLKYEFGDRAVRIFIYVNKQTILERLQAKAFSDDIIRHYMNHYMEEVPYRKECEHVFENIDVTETKARIREAVLSHLPATTS